MSAVTDSREYLENSHVVHHVYSYKLIESKSESIFAFSNINKVL